ncbi:DUF1186 domain-containing protein [Carnobacteriaceae bacterium 52-44]
MESTIAELRYYNEKFPRQALEEAIKNKEQTTEILLNELDYMIEYPESTIENNEYNLHFFTVYLLAQFREKEACQRILNLVSLPPEQVDFMFGDLITEDLNSIIYSTFDGHLEQLETVIENPEIDLYVRGAVLEVYEKLSKDGLVSREEFIEYLRKLLKHQKNGTESDLASIIQGVIIDNKLFEMMDDVQMLYDNGRIDESIVGKYDSFVDFMYDYSYIRDSVSYIDDAIEELYQWPMFEKTKEDKLEEEKRLKELEAEFNKITQNDRTDEKVGRNDPCPCGSGKKYKKCCLKKDNVYKNKHQEPLDVQKRWLRDYPVIEGEGKAGEIRITDKFDDESIEIDRLVYLALHHRTRPIWEETNHTKEERAKGSYLIDAFEYFKTKAEKENIQSFEEYDCDYKIHYRSKDWVKELRKMFEKDDIIAKFGDRSRELNEVIDQFS